jgi:hypothetical protein
MKEKTTVFSLMRKQQDYNSKCCPAVTPYRPYIARILRISIILLQGM